MPRERKRDVSVVGVVASSQKKKNAQPNFPQNAVSRAAKSRYCLMNRKKSRVQLQTGCGADGWPALPTLVFLWLRKECMSWTSVMSWLSPKVK